jgi:hypothetical protein
MMKMGRGEGLLWAAESCQKIVVMGGGEGLT